MQGSWKSLYCWPTASSLGASARAKQQNHTGAVNLLNPGFWLQLLASSHLRRLSHSSYTLALWLQQLPAFRAADRPSCCGCTSSCCCCSI